MPSKIVSPDYIWDREKDTLTKIYKIKIDRWANKTQISLKNKLEKREDFTKVSFVTILHNGESDTGKIEAWERTTVINSNNYHRDHYLIMELARGYLNPNISGWKTVPPQTKDIHSEESENEDLTDAKEDEPKEKDPDKKRKHNQSDTTDETQNRNNTHTIDARKQSIERQPPDKTNKRKDPPQPNTTVTQQGIATLTTQQTTVDQDQHKHKHTNQH